MSGAVFLEGDNCNLSTFEEDDFELYLEDFTGKDVLNRMLMDRPRSPKSMRERLEEDWLKDEENIVLVICQDSETAGYLFLRHEDKIEAEIGVFIRESFRRQGVGSEAVSLLVDYSLKELDYHRILARVLESNTASKNMLENLGFEKEGEEREKFFTEGEHRNIIRMSVLKNEWRRE